MLPCPVPPSTNHRWRLPQFQQFIPHGFLQSFAMGSQEDIWYLCLYCCADIKCAECEFFQQKHCPGDRMLHAEGLPNRPLPPPFFCERVSSAICSVPSFLPRIFVNFYYFDFPGIAQQYCQIIRLITFELRTVLLSLLRFSWFPRWSLSIAATEESLSSSTRSCITSWYAGHHLIGKFKRQ